MRNELKVFPRLSTAQFLSLGFTANKSALIYESITKIIELKHAIENEIKKKKHSKVAYLKKDRGLSSNIVRNWENQESVHSKPLNTNYNAIERAETK